MSAKKWTWKEMLRLQQAGGIFNREFQLNWDTVPTDNEEGVDEFLEEYKTITQANIDFVKKYPQIYDIINKVNSGAFDITKIRSSNHE